MWRLYHIFQRSILLLIILGSSFHAYATIQLVNSTIKPESGAGNCDGEAGFRAAGTAGPFTYSLVDHSTGVVLIDAAAVDEDEEGTILKDLCAGEYRILVNSRYGCERELGPFDIGSCTESEVEATITNSFCDGEAGSISLSNIPVDYSILWEDGSTEAVRNQLDAGTYQVTILPPTDDEGNNPLAPCQKSYSYEIITIPNEGINDIMVEVVNSSCGLSNGSILLSSVPEGYKVVWEDGLITDFREGLSQGEYLVAITPIEESSTDCIVYQSYTILDEEDGELQISNTYVNNFCSPSNYENFVAIVAVSMEGGVPPYQYNWSNVSADRGRSADITYEMYLNNPTVSVTITDECGTSVNQNVTVGTPPNIKFDYRVESNCGAANTAEIVLYNFRDVFEISDEPIDFTFQINGGTVITGSTNGSYEYRISEVESNRSYQITMLESDGFQLCGTSQRIEINDLVVPVTIQLDDKRGALADNGDFGGNVGHIEISTITNSQPVTYQWRNSNSDFSFSSTNEDIYNLRPDTYCVTATDNEGCQGTACFSVAPCESGNLSVNISAQDVQTINLAEGITGSIFPNVSSGFSLDQLTYAWSGPGTFDHTARDIDNLESVGVYTLTVTDPCGLRKTASFYLSGDGEGNRCACFTDYNLRMIQENKCTDERVFFNRGKATFEGVPARYFSCFPTEARQQARQIFIDWGDLTRVTFHRNQRDKMQLYQTPVELILDSDGNIEDILQGTNEIEGIISGDLTVTISNGLGCSFTYSYNYSKINTACDISTLGIGGFLPQIYPDNANNDVHAGYFSCTYCGERDETDIACREGTYSGTTLFTYEAADIDDEGYSRNPCSGGKIFLRDEKCNADGSTFEIENTGMEIIDWDTDREVILENGETVCEYDCYCVFPRGTLTALDPDKQERVLIKTTIIKDCDDAPDCNGGFKIVDDYDRCSENFVCEDGTIIDSYPDDILKDYCLKDVQVNSNGQITQYDLYEYCLLNGAPDTEDYVLAVNDMTSTHEDFDKFKNILPCGDGFQDDTPIDALLYDPEDIVINTLEDGNAEFFASGRTVNGQAVFEKLNDDFRVQASYPIGSTSTNVIYSISDIIIGQNQKIILGANTLDLNNNIGSTNAFFQASNLTNTLYWRQFQTSNNNNNNRTNGLVANSDSQILTTGFFTEGFTLNGNTLNTQGQDIYLLNLSRGGNVNWMRKSGGEGLDDATTIDTDGENNIFISGYINGDAQFSQINVNPAIQNKTSYFIAKYNPSGYPEWVKTAHIPNQNFTQSQLVVDNNNQVMVAGEFQNQFNFDNTNASIATTGNQPAVFLAKYDTDGNLLWANTAIQNINNNGTVNMTSINKNFDNSVLVAGHFTGNIQFNDGTVLQSRGGSDIYIVRFSADGQLIWVKHNGQENDEYCASLTTDGKGTVGYTGQYRSQTELEERVFETTNGALAAYVIGFSEELCYEELTFAKEIPSDNYAAQEKITTTAIVESNGVVGLQAGNVVHFKPGFHAKAGSNLHAYIAEDDCEEENESYTEPITTERTEESPIVKVAEPNLRAYPNPFTNSTTVEYQISTTEPVSLYLYNMQGERIADLLQNKLQTEGVYQIEVDVSRYPSGIYYATLRAGKRVLTEKLVVVK